MGMRIKRKRLKQLGRTDSGSLALSAISSDNGPKCMKMNCPKTMDGIEDSLHAYTENTA